MVVFPPSIVLRLPIRAVARLQPLLGLDRPAVAVEGAVAMVQEMVDRSRWSDGIAVMDNNAKAVYLGCISSAIMEWKQ